MPASWVTADEVDGGDPAPRVWLEDRGMAYVLAVKGTEPLVRRRRDGELASSACLGPASTSLVGLVRLTSQLGLLPSPSPRSTMAPLDRQPIPAGGREPDLIPKCGRSSK